MDARLKFSSPWTIHAAEINALFGNDPEVHVEYNDYDCEVKLYVDNAVKAQAIDMILPDEVEFGNVELSIVVVPSNNGRIIFSDFFGKSWKEIFDLAFENNPAYAFTKEVQGVLSNKIYYVVFKNKVVQFFGDNLNDLYGNISTLYQEIAKEVLNIDCFPNVFYCTDIEEKVGITDGRWP